MSHMSYDKNMIEHYHTEIKKKSKDFWQISRFDKFHSRQQLSELQDVGMSKLPLPDVENLHGRGRRSWGVEERLDNV